MRLSTEFWDTQLGLMLIGSDGSLRFTATGRARYAPLLAKYGFSISNVTTQNRFIEVMGTVNAGELAENTLKFEEILADRDTSQEERQLINRILKRQPEDPPRLSLVR